MSLLLEVVFKYAAWSDLTLMTAPLSDLNSQRYLFVDFWNGRSMMAYTPKIPCPSRDGAVNKVPSVAVRSARVARGVNGAVVRGLNLVLMG
jgi:hypothetical protein